MASEISLGFINSSVNKQLRASRKILDAMRQLKAIGEAAPEQRRRIEELTALLGEAAEEVIDSAADTGKTVADFVGRR